ncbi:MAG: diguanylate cyclase [Sideroxydans sp.]|nr:diguanylate cyclase [Sideroxydans sp.]
MLFYRSDEKIRLRDFFLRFVFLFFPAALLLTMVVVAYKDADRRHNLEITKVREAALVENARVQIAQDFHEVISTLRVLATTPALRHYVERGGAAELADLESQFLVVASESKRYDQIRLIDAAGMETVRVNFNDGQPAIVPRAKLQDKSGRYFFRDTVKLGQGEIYVSPLDLNIEHGELERPFKPMIRFGMPVFDKAGRKRGVLLLNYFGLDVLEHFRSAIQGGEQRGAMLLNRDGYWLSASKPEDEWGFMLGKAEHTFGNEFPAEWQTISTGDKGALKTKNGLFVFSTAHPLKPELHSSTGSPLPSAPSQREIAATDYYWKIVAFVSMESLHGRSFFNQDSGRFMLLVVYSLLALGIAIISYTSLGRRQALSWLQEKERNLREITGTMSDGLLVMDSTGRITFANKAVTTMLGYELMDMLGQDMHELMHVNADGTQEPRSACKMLKVLETGATYHSLEELFRCKDGSLLPVSVSASVLVKQAGSTGIVVAFHDITEIKRFERELERRAQTDVLTGLNNRRHFYELAEQELLRARRYVKPLALLMFDVDHFKQVNDSYGHYAGDAVLRKLSDVCLHTLREIDIVGRFGGEEFVVMMPETNTQHAMDAAERLRLALAATEVPIDSGEAIHFTVSIGVTCLCADDENVDAVLKRADTAMYQAKAAGRNQVSLVAAAN